MSSYANRRRYRAVMVLCSFCLHSSKQPRVSRSGCGAHRSRRGYICSSRNKHSCALSGDPSKPLRVTRVCCGHCDKRSTGRRHRGAACPRTFLECISLGVKPGDATDCSTVSAVLGFSCLLPAIRAFPAKGGCSGDSRFLAVK